MEIPSEEDVQKVLDEAVKLFEEEKHKDAILLISRKVVRGIPNFTYTKAWSNFAGHKEICHWVLTHTEDIYTWIKEDHGHQ
jgi:hypothetical protein